MGYIINKKYRKVIVELRFRSKPVDKRIRNESSDAKFSVKGEGVVSASIVEHFFRELQ
jgi:hypothetical protein